MLQRSSPRIPDSLFMGTAYETVAYRACSIRERTCNCAISDEEFLMDVSTRY
jgi:hypothetical protein